MEDKNHEGHGGWTIDQIAGASVNDFEAGLKPDIILLHAGTNDCNGNVDPANAPMRLGNLLDGLTNAWPDAAVLVAKIIPSTSGPVNDCINTYNTGVQGELFPFSKLVCLGYQRSNSLDRYRCQPLPIREKAWSCRHEQCS